MTLFAQGLFDLTVSETVLHIVRVIASVGGAVVGWFVCDLLTRVAYGASFRKATPGSLLLGVKTSGAAGLALLIYFFLPLGGGGGIGYGPGPGGLPGRGKGEGGDKIASGSDAKNDKPSKDGPKNTGEPKTEPKLVPVEIEILGGERLQNQRFYLVRGKGAPLTYEELKAYFEENRGKIKIIPVLTDDTVGLDRDNNPLIRLTKLADECRIERLPHKMPES